MTNGGYQIIDLKNINLKVGTGTKIDGVYDKIKSIIKLPPWQTHLDT